MKNSRSSSPDRNRRFQPRLEALEDRVNPVQFTVTNLLDSGAGSFRDAVTAANALPGQDDIVFAGGAAFGTVGLTTGQITISDSLTITGTSRALTAISGSGVDRILTVNNGANVTISSLTLANGVTTGDGGAILLNDLNDLGSVTLNDVVVIGNTADEGGAISAPSGGTVTITNSWLRDNTAITQGGAIQIENVSLSVFNTTISNNVSGSTGGGIAVEDSIANVVQTTITNNAAAIEGGGIEVANSALTLSNSTVFQNDAGISGGGLVVDSSISVVNISSSIIALNTVSSGGIVGSDISGEVDQFDSNLISTANGLTAGSATGTVVGDPLLNPLAMRGGDNPIHVLRFGSPAINRGLALPAGFGTDESRGTGFVRNYSGLGVDIGATEFGAGLGIERVAVGSDAGIPTTVRVFNGAGTALTTIQPYIPAFTGGSRVATGDFNGDGIQDIVTAAGPGGGPNVKVFDGVTFGEIASFFAFESSFDGGVSLGVADINADGVPDIICAAGPGGGPRVLVVDGTRLDLQDSTGKVSDTALLASFFAYIPAFQGGVTVAAGDFNGDGRADLAFAAGPGGGPHVRVIDGTQLNIVNDQGVILDAAGLIGDTSDFSSFFAFGNGLFTGGVVLTAGDVNGDGLPDLMVGIASLASPNVFVRDAATKATLPQFTAFEATFTNGVRLASVDTDGNGSAESIVVGRGRGGVAQVRTVNGANPAIELFNDVIFPGFTGGIFVG